MQDNDTSRRRKFYDQMSETYDLGSFEEFDTKMNNPESRRKLHEFIDKDGKYDIGDFEYFDNAMKPIEQTLPKTAEQPVQTPTVEPQQQSSAQVPASAEMKPATVSNNPQPAAPVEEEKPKEPEYPQPYDALGNVITNNGEPYSQEVLKRYYSKDNRGSNYRDLAQISEEVAREQSVSNMHTTGGAGYVPSQQFPIAEPSTEAKEQEQFDAEMRRLHANSTQSDEYQKLYGMFDDAFKNGKAGGKSAYAQANALADEMGLDNEQKYSLLSRINRQYASDRAAETVQSIIDQMPEHSADPMEALRELYYNRELQLKLWQTAENMGNDYDQYVNMFIKPQLIEAMKQKYGGTDSDWIGVKGLFSNWQHVSDRLESQDVSGLLGEHFAEDIDKSIDDAFAKALEKEGELQQFAKNTDNAGAQLGALMYAKRQSNLLKDPDRIMDAFEQQLFGQSGGEGGEGGGNDDKMLDVAVKEILTDPNLSEEIFRRAESKNMSVIDYTKKYVIPQMVQAIRNRFEQSFIQREMPKSTIEHIMKGITEDNVIAMIANTYMRTDSQQRIVNEAEAMTTQGLNPDVDTNVWIEGARLATGMAADFWLWGGWGKLGAKATGELLAKRVAERAAAEHITKEAAMRLVEEEGKQFLGRGVVESMMRHIPQSAVTMAGAEGTSELVRSIKDREDALTVIGNTLGAVGSGAFTGTMFGVTGGATGRLASKLSGAKRLAGKLASYGVEAGTMYTAEELQKIANGEEAFENPYDGLIESAIKLGFIKLSANPLATGVKLLDAIAHPVKAIKGAMTPDRPLLTEDDVRIIRKSAEGTELMDALTRMRPARNTDKGEREGYISEADAEIAATAYRNFMTNPDIPWVLKNKVAHLLGGVIAPAGFEVSTEIVDTDGGSVLRTRDIDGNLISETKYDSHEAAQEAADNISNALFDNTTAALQERINSAEAYARFNDYFNEAYAQAADKMAKGLELTKADKQIIYLHQHADEVLDVYNKAQAGEELAEGDADLADLYRQHFEGYVRQSRAVDAFTREYEATNGLSAGTVEKALKGHTEEEAKQLADENGEGIYKAGEVWRTESEQKTVSDYQQAMRQRIAEFEGQGIAVENAPNRFRREYNLLEDSGDDGGTPPPPPAGTSGGSDGTETGGSGTVNGQNRTETGGSGTAPERTERRDAAYNRGAAVAQDPSSLSGIGYDNRLAQARLIQLMPESDPTLNRLRNEIMLAVESGNDEAADRIINEARQYGQLNDVQVEAIEQYRDAAETQKGIDDAIAEQSQKYEEVARMELEDIASADGSVRELQLRDGSTVYYKSGDLDNQYGGVYVADLTGETRQVPVREIVNIGEPQNLDDIVADSVNRYAAGLQTQYETMASGYLMDPGQRVDMIVSGQPISATVVSSDLAGNVIFQLEDGSQIPMSQADAQQAIATADSVKIQQQLRSEAEAASLAEQQQRYGKGIKGYSEGQPDLSAPETDVKTAADYLLQQTGGDDKVRKSQVADIQTNIDQLRQRQIADIQVMQTQTRWLEGNEDIADPSEIEQARLQISDATRDLADAEARMRKWGDIRQQLMNPEEKAKFEGERRKKVFAARTGYRPSEQQRLSQNEDRITINEDGTLNFGQTPASNVNNYLLKNYTDAMEAEQFMNEQRVALRNQQRDVIQPEMNRLNDLLNDYVAGRIELSDSEVKNIAQQVADLEQRQDDLSTQAVNLRTITEGIPALYERNGRVEELTPAEQRGKALDKAKSREDKLRVARNIYKEYPEALDIINDQEAKSIEEYISQSLPQGKLNWEGFDRGERHIAGVQEAVFGKRGATRGIGKEYTTNAFNQYLAPEGSGMGFDEMVHYLYEDAPEVDGRKLYDDTEIRDALISMLLTAQKSSDISHLLIDNRIAEAEDIVRRQEELEGEAEEEAKYQELQEWADAHHLNPDEVETYNDYLAEQPWEFDDEVINQIIADNEQDQRSKEVDSQHPDGTVGSEGEGSQEQVPVSGSPEGADTNTPVTGKQGAEGGTGSPAVSDNDVPGGAQGELSSFPARLAEAKAETDVNPTEAQKKAGNYKMGHISFGGYRMSIENPKGSTRSGVDANQKPWSIEMKDSYGYIGKKYGTDGDHLDFFINDDADLDTFEGRVYVVDQKNDDGSFDEHKVMYGYKNWSAARKAYERNYEDGWWDKHVMQMIGVKKADFDKWLSDSDHKTKPFADYWRTKNSDTVSDPVDQLLADVAERKDAAKQAEVKPTWDSKQLSKIDNQGLVQLRKKAKADLSTSRVILGTIDVNGEKAATLKKNIAQAETDLKVLDAEIEKRNAIQKQLIDDMEAGGAMVDHLQNMGIDVTDNISEMRKARKKAEQDNSKEGKLRKMTTSDGSTYGFAYRGGIYLDPRKINANLPLHEYGHLWCEAFRRLNPEGWKDIVGIMKQDADTWNFVKQLNPNLTSEDDIAEEVIAKGSGDNGEERIRQEFDRMSQRDPSYKSKWANIWKNISKAIQDFWKKVGDFLHIKYESPQQVYDQVLKDFANGVNPRKKVEQYLKQRDADYMQAAESGDTRRAAEIFNEALKENVGNGMTPFVAVDNYRKLQQTARKIKKGDQAAIDKAAEMMAPLIPENAVLVPVPSHEGKATDMLQLANAISSLTGSEVADILTGTPRKSQYENKKEGGKALSSSELGITKNGNLPEGKIPVVIDNVVDSGNTAEACIKALGTGMVVSLADSANKSSHAATLKSAEPIVLDKDGKVVPLSKRFDLTSGRYLGRRADALDNLLNEIERRQEAAEDLVGNEELQAAIESSKREKLTPIREGLQKRATKAVVQMVTNTGVPIKQVSQKEANQMMQLFTMMNIREIAGLALQQRPSDIKRYAVINANDPYAVPKYFETRKYADEYRVWGNRAGGAFITLDLDTYKDQAQGLQDAANIQPQLVITDNKGNTIQFMFDGSRQEQPAFYSNALRAVEGIKQDKATPEQWLAMIQKGGGLKAGEDKWIGLSDFLNENKGKSLTKQEIMNFIRKNQIQVEETKYREYFNVDDNPRMQELRREFSSLLDKYEHEKTSIDRESTEFNDEMYEKYGRGWASDPDRLSEDDQKRNDDIIDRYHQLWDEDLQELAFREMAKKYGNDFENAFEVNYSKTELKPHTDMYGEGISDAAKNYLKLDDRPINSTRLDYTTQGLDNKREIALTVPSVGPYKESDDIHFGDAGGGRAVAWVRFGDAFVPIKEDVVETVGEFEEPWDNGRGSIIYWPKGKSKGRDYIVYGKRRDGSYGYGVDVSERVIGVYDTLDDAKREMNAYYQMHPKKRTVGDKRVLVIDEIQSKRHQDARELGYQGEFSNSPKKQYERAYDKLQEYRDDLEKKYGEYFVEDQLTGEERTKYNEMYQDVVALSEVKDKKVYSVPDAPFEKNWHELAMKRMLRYAAENGYDKIAWTTGDQQADRYNLAKVVNSIDVAKWGEDINQGKLDIEHGYKGSSAWEPSNQVEKSIKDYIEYCMSRGESFALSVAYAHNQITDAPNESVGWTDEAIEKVADAIEADVTGYKDARGVLINLRNDDLIDLTVDKEGKILDASDSEFEGKSLADVVGKEVAQKIIDAEGGKKIGTDNLHIGGEGMKGFYDEILPRFMNKYGKKWGVKVGEIDLPNLEKSARKMWSIDVTPEMKESVMQGQPIFQKERRGRVYGWTDGQGISLTPDGLNPNTPMHEYTHIWDKYIQKHDPQLWKDMVATFKKTAMWQQLRENPDYRAIWNDDNRMASEVHSRLTGARSEEEFNKAAANPDNKDADSIIKEVRDVLRRFWERLAELFGFGRDRLEEFILMPLRDALNGFNPITGDSDGRPEAMVKEMVEKTLMGVHNISEDKLRKAIKQGGLANPSMAVIDTKQHMHTDYGEISLIPKASLIDSKTGRNAGTFTADAWTPSYPPVSLVMKDAGWNKVMKDLRSIKENVDGGKEIYSRLRVYLESYLDNRDPDAMYWWYMHDRGLNPKTVRNESAYDKNIQERVMDVTGGDINKGIEDLSDKDAKEMVDLYHDYKKQKGEEVSSAEERIQKLKDRLKDPNLKPMVKLSRERWLKDLEKYGEVASSVSQFMQNVIGDKQREGQVNEYSTFMEARKAVEREGRKADYEKWLNEFNTRYGVEEKIFTGYDNYGTPKYVRNTLEIVSKLMKKDGLNGAVNWSSIGNWIAKVANKEKTLEGIRKNKKNLATTKEQHDAFHENWGNLLYPISKRLGNGDMYHGENIMSDILEHKDYAGYYKREYGKELTQQEKDTIDEFIKQVRTNFPTGYFETKFERPVYLNEFEVAVIPEGTSPDVVEALKNAGLDVRTYDTSDYDSKEDKRRQATIDAVTKRSDILFQIERPTMAGEKPVRSLMTEGNLFTDADFMPEVKASKKEKDITKLSDKQLLDAISKSEAGQRRKYIDEYDRRHVDEHDEQKDAYVSMLIDNNTSLEDAYQMYDDAFRLWKDRGYASADRTKLMAQIDALETYIADKEEQALDSQMEEEAEAEATKQQDQQKQQYEQQKQEVKQIGYDLTKLRLRELEEDETCHVERRYEENGTFTFTGKEKIESVDDVAYIFKQLENAAIENSFLVLEKDGVPTIIHLGVGNYTQTVAEVQPALAAYNELKPEKVYFVHNHPSGSLMSSKPDKDVMQMMRAIFGRKLQDGIIIDTTSGKYGIFNEGSKYANEKNMPKSMQGELPVKVYSFSKQVFDEGWNPETAFAGDSSHKIAQFVSSHRLGEHKKMSLIVMNQNWNVTGNVFLPYTSLAQAARIEGADLIARYMNQMGGTMVAIYGSYDYNDAIDRQDIDYLRTLLKARRVPLRDVIHIDHSAHDMGLVGEEMMAREDAATKAGEAKEVKMGNIEDKYSDGVTIDDSIEMSKDVRKMSPAELIRQYKRLNSEMLDENGLDIDQQEDAFRKEWFSKHGIEGFGQASADHLTKQANKYTYKKMALRWDILDRIEELGLKDYLNRDDLPEEAVADIVRMYRHTTPAVGKANTRFNQELDRQINDPDFPKNHIYKLGKPGPILLSTGFPNDDIELSASHLLEKSQKVHHPFDLGDVKNLVKAINDPIAVFSYGNKDKSQNVIVELTKDGKNFVVGIHFKQGHRGLEVSDIRGIFPRDNAEWLNWITQRKHLYLNKEKIQSLIAQQRRILAEVSYLDLNSVAKIVNNFQNPNLSEENLRNIYVKEVAAAEDTADMLGGVKIVFESQAPKEGALGWYDPNINTIHVVLPEHTSVDEVKRTVCHEKLGHEGLVALLGSQAEVNKFGQFVYETASKALRKRIVAKADEEGYDWTDPLRFSKAAQEVIGGIAENGPRSADEFSLWRKIKHYLIRLCNKLGLRIRGLLNDHDLAYYILKTGEALKKWNDMPDSRKEAFARQNTNFDNMYSRRGKPRKRNDESMAQYLERLRNWERWKIAEEQAAANNDPMPEADKINEKWENQYKADLDAWKAANGIDAEDGATGPGAFPRRAQGETPQEYAARVADYETRADAWRDAPSFFDYMQRANDEYKNAYSEWKMRYGIAEAESVDLHLYEGTDRPEIVDPADLEADMRAEADFAEAAGVDVSSEGASRHAKLAIIERRKNLESANAEDAIWIHNITKSINYEAERQGVDPKMLREAMADIIEGTYFEDVLRDEQGNVVTVVDISDRLPIKMTTGLKDILDTIKDWYDEFYHFIEDAGLRNNAGYIAEGYVNHIWSKEKSNPDAWEKYVENFQRTKSPNMRERMFKTYREGEDIGLVRKYKDIADILAYYSSSNNQAVANRKMLDALSFIVVEELNSDGEVVSALPLLNSSKPNIMVADRYKMYQVPGVGDVWVVKDIQRQFANVFGTMRTQDIPEWLTKTGRIYDVAGSTAKKIELAFSAFHMGALTEVAMAQMRPDRALKALWQILINDMVIRQTIPAYAHPEDFKFAASHLVQLGATQDYSSADVNNVTEKFREMVREAAESERPVRVAGYAVTPLAAALDYINKGMDKVLWNYLHDGLKIACFKMFAEQIEKRVEKEGLTPEKREELLDEAGQYVNDTFGGQYFELLNISPALIKWLRRAFLSPDWLISTQRHFLANAGFGSLYSESGFLNYLRYNRDNIKRVFGADIPRDENRRFRSKNAKQCYLLGVCGFFYVMMNALNAMFRAQDEEKEKEKAEEERKINPDYLSPYELAYPDGMKWYDYTMYGNTIGQQTHLFLGRYNDGTEWYARWGKQFREFPELFMGRHGVEFPTPLMERMSGKANPIGRYLMYDLPLTVGMYGYRQPRETQEIAEKYGNTVALLAMTAKKFLPFSVPTQEDKEFKMFDLVMPSQKGFTKWKAVDFFKTYIQAGDMDGIQRTYNAVAMNGIDAEGCLKAAIATVKATQRKELSDGVASLQDAMDRFDAAKDVKEKKYFKSKITKYLAEQNYKVFTRDEAIEQVNSFLNGDQPTDNEINKYMELSTSADVRDDYRLSMIRKQAKKFVDEVKTSEGERQKKLRSNYDAWFKVDAIIKEATKNMNKIKKQLGKQPVDVDGEKRDDRWRMKKIREIRSEAQKKIDEIQAP